MEGPHPSKLQICITEGHVPMKLTIFSGPLVSIRLPYRLPPARAKSSGHEVAFVLNACARCGFAFIAL